jgi:hypothetical protein
MRQVYRFFGLLAGQKKRAENKNLYPAVSHSCRRSGRSSALPYPPHEYLILTFLTSGRFFVVKMGDFSKLKINLVKLQVVDFLMLKWVIFLD